MTIQTAWRGDSSFTANPSQSYHSQALYKFNNKSSLIFIDLPHNRLSYFPSFLAVIHDIVCGYSAKLSRVSVSLLKTDPPLEARREEERLEEFICNLMSFGTQQQHQAILFFLLSSLCLSKFKENFLAVCLIF